MDNGTEFLCQSVRKSFEDGYLVIVYCIQCVICLLVIPSAAILSFVVAKSRALHRNVRILLVNFIISSIVTDLGVLIIAVYHLVGVTISKSDITLCLWVALSGKDCALLNAVRNYGIFMASISLMFLAIERIVATIQFKTYEKSGRKAIGIGLSITQWVVSISALPVQQFPDRRFAHCMTGLMLPRMVEGYFSVMILAQGVGLCIFIALAYANSKKMAQYTFNDALKLLSTRYQLKENVSTTKLMIPIAISGCFLFVICLLTIEVFVRQLPDISDVSSTAEFDELTENIQQSYIHWREIGTITPLIFTAFLSFILPYYSLHVRRTALKILGLNHISPPHCLRSKRVDQEVYRLDNARQQYFDALETQWR